MIRFIALVFALATIFIRIPSAQSAKKEFPCDSLPRENYTCSSCISYHPACAWCKKKGFDNDNKYSRCDTYDRLIKHGCIDVGDIENPKTKMQIQEDEELSDAGTDIAEEEAVQLRPQEVIITIRPKDKVTFPVTYRQAVDYPVDLYYMMDLSQSMSDDKEKLKELGDLLSNRMKQITKNFRLGFGSFVDKKLMPFVDPRPEKQDKPCKQCVEPYGFKNHMRLTTNTHQFKTEVNAANISGNLDAPEGGLDAVMQSLVCESEIGWRAKSRKMLVYSSDAGFHYAGDGRMAGVVIPNDGQCHLDGRGYYTMSQEQDYPSIALMHQKIREKQSNLIFAVTKEQKALYERLQRAMPDVSSSVGELADDSRNIVDLIEGEYKKISGQIIMTDNLNTTDGLRISYKAKCDMKKDFWNDTNRCDGIKVGDEIIYNVTVELTKCTDQKQFLVKLGPSGLSDYVDVKVNVLCDCECTNDDTVVKGSEECNHQGDMVCGVCRCTGTNVGRKCECDAPGVSTAELDAKCKKTNDSIPCEGRGVCDCGVCSCGKRTNPLEVIKGRYCECDNFNCPRHNRKICADHGECVCQSCECEEGWTGRACECPVSEDTCRSPNGQICNNKGKCICGKCKCYTDSEGNTYSGLTCEICPTCPTKCDEYRPCVMCQQFQTGPYNATQCDDCPFKVIPVPELPEIYENETKQHCQFVDPADDCTFYFIYDYNEETGNMTVWVKEEKDCPPPVPVLAIVLGVIAGIVLIGLILLLVWKLLTFLHDRREFAKFENERLNAKWDTGENPIFHPATSTFKNPAYGGKQ